jgi:predicted oxidoreductase
MAPLTAPDKNRLAYGFWRYREDEVEPALAMIALARENGIDHFDVADVYGGPGGFGGAERLLGAVRKRAPGLFAGATLATKAGVEIGTPYNSEPAYLRAACEASLSRLGVEQIDLFYVHRHDLLTHPADLAGALDALVECGRAATIGVSNFTSSQIDALTQYLRAPLRAHQIEFSAACLTPIFDGVLDQAMRRNIAVAAWSPLAGGRLATDPDFTGVRDAIAALAARYGAPPAAVALNFILRHPAQPTPILGTKSAARFAECLKADAFTLSRQEWYALVQAGLGKNLP